MPTASNPYLPMVAQAAKAAGIDPTWAQATLMTENAPGNPSAVSPAGAVGLMQILPTTAPGVNLDNPQANINASVKILANNLRAAGGDKSKASAMYFDGPNAKQFGPGAYQYVQKVANNYNALEAPQVSTQTALSAQTATPTPALDALMQKAQQQLTAPNQGQAQPQAGGAQQTQTPALDALMNNAQAQITAQQNAPKPSMGSQIVAGAEHGLHEITDVPAEALAGGVGDAVHSLGFAPNWHPGQTTRAADQAASAQYQQQMAQYPAAQAANVGTQILGGAAMLGGGEGLLNAGAAGAKVALAGGPLEGVGNAASGVARFITGQGGKGIIGRTASLAAQGATQTGAFDALTGAPITPAGLAVGAVANPILAGAGHFVGSGAEKLAASVTPKSTQAAKTVLGALDMDGVSKPDLAPIGRNGNTLMDVGGPNTQLLAQAIANKPGAAAAQINQALEGSVKSGPDAVRAAVHDALGSNGDIYDLRDSVTQQQKETAGPLYEKAYAVGPVWNDTLANLLERPSVAAAWKKAQNIAGDEGIKLPQVFATNDDGQITDVKNIPDMQTWDYIKRGLDDVIQAHSNPITGKIETDAARVANNVKKQLVSTLDEANPAYAEARAAYAGPAAVQNAIQMGRNVFKQDSEITDRQIAKMSQSEKSAFQAGAARAVLDQLPDEVQNGKNAVQKLFNKPQFSAKLKAAFADPQQFEQFSQILNDIGNQAATRNEVLKGSQSAKRLAAQAHDWTGTGKRALLNALAGHHLGAVAELSSGLMNRSAAEGDPELDSEIANLLTSQNSGHVVGQLNRAIPGKTKQAISALTGGAGKAIRVYSAPALLQPGA